MNQHAVAMSNNNTNMLKDKLLQQHEIDNLQSDTSEYKILDSITLSIVFQWSSLQNDTVDSFKKNKQINKGRRPIGHLLLLQDAKNGTPLFPL